MGRFWLHIMQTAPRHLVLASCSHLFAPVCIHWLAAPCFSSRNGKLPIGSKVLERMSADCHNDATSHWAATPVPARLRRRALAPTMLGYPHSTKGQKSTTRIAFSFRWWARQSLIEIDQSFSSAHPQQMDCESEAQRAEPCLKGSLLRPRCI